MVEYEPVIGLEVHAQLKTKTKIFCGCPTDFGAAQNDHVCPVCLGMPGVLPVLNKQVVEYAVRIGIALNSTVSEFTKFDRKNYFYPDLPKAYQISQFNQPICVGGHLMVHGKRIRLHRAHLEEDAGKLVHAGAAGLHGSDYSLVDYNRGGVPLMEIVSEPDIENADMARDYLMELRRILRYIDVCDGNLEEGSFRCDANVSIRLKGATELGTKAELKNMNSFSAVKQGIEFEIKRQTDVLNSGGRVVQESRLWHEATKSTHSMRSKEEAHDYRYFPEPDIPPILIDRKWVDSIKASLPELPEARRRRYIEQSGLSPEDAHVLAENQNLSDFFDACVHLGAPAKEAANQVINNIISYLNENTLAIGSTKLSPQNIKDLVQALKNGQLNSSAAKTVLAELLHSGGSVEAVVDAKGLAQVSDAFAIEEAVKQAISANPAQTADYRAADEAKQAKLKQFFFGQVMKALKGKGNPAVINKILDDQLNA